MADIAKATPPTGSGALNVLFIGNSYTFVHDIPAMVRALASGEERPLSPTVHAPGATTLEDHWATTGGREQITARRWDYVVLQEQSMRPIQSVQLFYRYADLLAAEVKKAGAQPVFYMTWARQATPGAQPQLTEAYRTAAARAGARVAPVGEAFKAVLASDPGVGLFEDDGSHPSTAGAYLAACTIYATLYGKSPVGLPSSLATSEGAVSIPAEQVGVLQRAAWNATAAYR